MTALKPNNQSGRQRICEANKMKKTIPSKKKKTAKKTTKKPNAKEIMTALIAHDLLKLSRHSGGKLTDYHISSVCKKFKADTKRVVEILKRNGVQIILVN